MPRSFFNVPMLVLCTLLLACNKNKDPVNITTIVGLTSISDSGNAVAGFPLYFRSVASGVTVYSWNFGDGTTSSDANPIHIYSTGGTYNVSLTINNDNLFSRQMSLWVDSPPPFESLLFGTRTFLHYHVISLPGFRDTSVKENVPVTIANINSIYILFGNDTLFLEATRPPYNDTLAYFFRFIVNGTNHQTQMSLSYHHSVHESMIYTKWDQQFGGTAEFDYYYYPY